MRRRICTILIASVMLSMLLAVQLNEMNKNVVAEGIESNLTDDDQIQQNPAIYEDRVVWAENVYEDGSWNWEIFLYDLSMDLKIRITYNEFNQFNPEIYGDIIVWEDGRNFDTAKTDIYMYDLSEDTDDDDVPNYLDGDRPDPDPAEIRITTDPAHQEKPAIYSTKIVWVDLRWGNRDVFIYDMISGKEAIIAGLNEVGDPRYRPSQDNPRIYGDKVVWEDERYSFGIWEICMYNLSTDTDGDGVPNYLDDDRPYTDPAEERITYSSDSDFSPSVYGDNIVFVRSDEVILYDLKTKLEHTLTESTSGQEIDGQFCNFHGTKVVWAYDVGGLKDIYLYDLAIDTDGDDTPNYRDPDKPSPDPAIVRITNESETISMRPAIYTNKIVWQDNRNLSKPWDSDIYLYELTDNLPPEIIYFMPDYIPEIWDYESQRFNVSAFDPELVELSYTWFFDEVQLLGETTDTFDFISDHDSAGVHQVKVVVSDGEYPIEKVWLFNVLESNVASPIFILYHPMTNPAIIEGEEITLSIRAIDEDSENLSVSWTWDQDLIPTPQTSNTTIVGEVYSELSFTSQLDYNGSNYDEHFNIIVEVTDGKHTTSYKWILTILFFDDADMDGYFDKIEIDGGWDPLDRSSKPTDKDNDLIMDAEDNDKDGDGFLDEYDEYPLDQNKQLDERSDSSLEIMFIIITLILVIVAIISLPRILKS